MKFILSIFLLLPSFAFSQSVLDVQALDASRNCWYRHFKQTETLQIADFGGFDPKAYRFSTQDIKNKIQEAIISKQEEKNYTIDNKGKFEVYLFCSSGGHSIVINSYESEPSYIYSTSLQDLSQGSFALNNLAKSGFELGTSLHTLIIKKKKDIDAKNFIHLVKSFFPEVIASARFIPNNDLGKIRVLPAYYFKLKQVIKDLEEHQVMKHFINYIELSPKQMFSGESGLILNGIF